MRAMDGVEIIAKLAEENSIRLTFLLAKQRLITEQPGSC